MMVCAVAGWKDSGKTTLVERLVGHFAARGFSVATVKHSHDAFLMDRPGTDTDRHRRAGAAQVAMVGSNGWTLARSEPEPSLDAVLAALHPADLVVVEGYKRSSLPKIEVIADEQAEAIWRTDREVFAVASELTDPTCPLPRFPRDDIAALADAMLAHLRMSA